MYKIFAQNPGNTKPYSVVVSGQDILNKS